MRSAKYGMRVMFGCVLLGVHHTSARAQESSVSQPQLDTRLYRLPIDSEATLWTNDAGSAPTGHFLD